MIRNKSIQFLVVEMFRKLINLAILALIIEKFTIFLMNDTKINLIKDLNIINILEFFHTVITSFIFSLCHNLIVLTSQFCKCTSLVTQTRSCQLSNIPFTTDQALITGLTIKHVFDDCKFVIDSLVYLCN